MSEQSERAARWREHVERWHRSGQTQAAYSAEHGVSKKSLGYWIRRGRLESVQQSDQALTLVAARPAVAMDCPLQAGGGLSLRSPSGWGLEFDTLPSASWLAELLTQAGAR